MSTPTYFFQECPTCHRSLRIRVDYLGQQVTCKHCQAHFEACDPQSSTYPPEESGIALLARADKLLKAAESARAREVQGSAD